MQLENTFDDTPIELVLSLALAIASTLHRLSEAPLCPFLWVLIVNIQGTILRSLTSSVSLKDMNFKVVDCFELTEDLRLLSNRR